MSVVLNNMQLRRFAAALNEQETSTTQRSVYLVADSPNVSRSVEKVHGTGSRPDLAAVLNIGKRYGMVQEATMVANPGLPTAMERKFERLGYSVYRGLGPDCDDRVISKCVSNGIIADTLVVLGGDHCMVDVIRLVKNQRRRVWVVVVGLKETTAECIRTACDEFIDLPVILNPVAA